MAQITLLPTKDAELYSGDPDHNNGNSNNFKVGRYGSAGFDYFRSVLHFNLATVASRQITGATLRLCQANYGMTTSSPLLFSAFCISQDWSESGVTWDTMPSFTDVGAVSLSLSGDIQGWRNFNITSLIQDIIHNSRTYYGIMLRQPGDEGNVWKGFFSSEQAGYEPQLILDYIGGFKAKVSGAWKDTDTYAKVSGVWRQCDVYTKVSGVWRQGQ